MARFGVARHAEWLTLYAAVQGCYRDGWMPDSYYLEQVMPRVNGVSHHLARVRATTPAFFDHPAICDLLYALNGRFLRPDFSPLPPTEACDLLAGHGPDLVFKADQSGFGRGVQILSAADLSPERLLHLGNGVFQPKLSAHPELDGFGSRALTTLRIGTALTPDGRPEVRCCYLKIGRPGHAHVIARDQLRVAVDWHSGALDEIGYLSDWHPVTCPPGVATPFHGSAVPAIADATHAAVSLHLQLPLAGYICWDFAIDAEARVRLLEWEGGVVGFAEAVQGPCFEHLDWVTAI
ncbi:sugar-transfer associated ATP-grasp domain-containing protein [Antarctobacter sp.]|uniref:sugar-transfer associated ATP-grasp domain-containing protein n=1 Tax=Antarctobacter sp. TaxID=1872577 RepID=UPI003A92838D